MYPEQQTTNQPIEPPKPKIYHTNHRREGIKSIVTTVVILLIAPILAILITTYVFQSYEVDGPSMEPTLQDQDRLIIWKAGRTWSRITNEPYIPERNAVIVFVKRGLFDFNSGKEKQLIKRVIGLPGDRIVVDNGKVTVFNNDFPNGHNPDETYDYGKDLTDTTEGNVDVTVGANEVFVMGDNRANSLDSREFGPIPVNDVIGTLSARVLPLSSAQKF